LETTHAPQAISLKGPGVYAAPRQAHGCAVFQDDLGRNIMPFIYRALRQVNNLVAKFFQFFSSTLGRKVITRDGFRNDADCERVFCPAMKMITGPLLVVREETPWRVIDSILRESLADVKF
jgi:hypothetical protein